MIKSVYSKYFQKSKSFLYPALGIKKNNQFKPSGTYLAIRDCVGPEDVKLICTFEQKDTDDFTLFEKHFLLENPLFVTKMIVDNSGVYVFDFQIYEQDWFNFILGKYSKLSNVLKRAIKQHYGESSSEYKFLEIFINPVEYFEDYAELLDVPIENIKQIGELCDPCDIEKETLIIPNEYLEELKKELNL